MSEYKSTMVCPDYGTCRDPEWCLQGGDCASTATPVDSPALLLEERAHARTSAEVARLDAQLDAWRPVIEAAKVLATNWCPGARNDTDTEAENKGLIRALIDAVNGEAP